MRASQWAINKILFTFKCLPVPEAISCFVAVVLVHLVSVHVLRQIQYWGKHINTLGLINYNLLLVTIMWNTMYSVVFRLDLVVCALRNTLTGWDFLLRAKQEDLSDLLFHYESEVSSSLTFVSWSFGKIKNIDQCEEQCRTQIGFRCLFVVKVKSVFWE